MSDEEDRVDSPKHSTILLWDGEHREGEEKTADPATLKRPVTPLKIRPFPLGSPFLESIRLAEQLDSHGVDDSEIVTLPPPSSPVVGSDYYSQPSSDASDSDDVSIGTLQEHQDRSLSQNIMEEDFDSDEESSEIDSDVDASGLCRWCDQALPEEISPILRGLIERAKRFSFTNRRKTNPYGLKAPLNVFSPVCARHKFEGILLPLAREHQWPEAIDWRDVSVRVQGMKSLLQGILDDEDPDWKRRTQPHEDPSKQTYDSDREYDDERKAHPRWGSIFWKTLLKNAQKTSSHRALGIRGEFDSFHSTQPGYYGEMGFEVILHTLYDLFPPAEIAPRQTAPLSGEQFVRKILLSEACVELIMCDREENRAQALLTKAASAEYGVGMFPEGDNDVVDEILTRRIRANRRNWEDEEDPAPVLEKVANQTRKRRILKKRPRPASEIAGITDVKTVAGTSKKIRT